MDKRLPFLKSDVIDSAEEFKKVLERFNGVIENSTIKKSHRLNTQKLILDMRGIPSTMPKPPFKKDGS